MKHNTQLKIALGVASVHTETSMWRYKAPKGEQGTQIDLLIDRQDLCINICEMKFSIDEFVISKSYATELENKLKVFRSNTGTRKTIFLTMVTTYEVKSIKNYPGLIQQEVKMDALFK